MGGRGFHCSYHSEQYVWSGAYTGLSQTRTCKFNTFYTLHFFFLNKMVHVKLKKKVIIMNNIIIMSKKKRIRNVDKVRQLDLDDFCSTDNYITVAF